MASENIEAVRLRTWLVDTAPPTQAELAREAGVSKQHVWKVLHGVVQPSRELLQAAERLGLPPYRPLKAADSSTAESP